MYYFLQIIAELKRFFTEAGAGLVLFFKEQWPWLAVGFLFVGFVSILVWMEITIPVR